MSKKIIKYIVFLCAMPLLIIGGALIFPQKSFAVVSLLTVLFACVPFFISFEYKKSSSRTLVIIAVMTALSVAGRFVFSPIPFFKPVTTIVIITALYMGEEAGFLTGALSAVISNFYFGQGPWTPFQMFAWGIVGFTAGILRKRILQSKIIMTIYALLSGILYSFIMDIWTTLWADGYFNISRFFASIATAAPVTAIYAVSNVIFLLLLAKPIGKKLDRIKTKYGL
ncbi:MAG: ECF transporter S component [Oscillospiraceae bacterium]|nr:ECF transporter S component [Oscillospiraceae bacterium]